MRRFAAFVMAASICCAAVADEARDAYQEAYTSAQGALAIQLECEQSVKKGDMAPCKKAEKAYDEFKAKSSKFLASVKPEDLFQHVTPEEMSGLTQANTQIGESMDRTTAYLRKK
ncbi:hypothetical protein [Pseudomonas fulva]|uniref:hypothetical protein n=1 Tax=Pseudomonas fulva TaxID=47880 RepID=UPI003F928790